MGKHCELLTPDERAVIMTKKADNCAARLRNSALRIVCGSVRPAPLRAETKKPAMPADTRVIVLKGNRWSPRQESNLYLALRRRSFYPLNYEETWG